MKTIIKSFLNSSIRRKLMVIDTIISFTALLILTAFTIAYQFHNIQESTIKELELAGKITSQLLAPVMEFSEDREDAYQTLDTLNSKESIVSACVYRADKSLFVSKNYGDKNLSCPTEPHAIGSETTLNHVCTILEVTSPNNTLVGFIYLASDMRELHHQIIEFSELSIVIMFVIFLLVYITTKKVHRIITAPIIKLTKLAESVQEKENYSARFEGKYNDEIGTLGNAFNNMMTRIKGRDDMLEKKVAERTQDLSFTIKRLEKISDDRKRMVQNVSHEFRTPLHAMGQYSHFIMSEVKKNDFLTPKIEKYGNRVLEAHQRLVTLTEGLLDLSALESGKVNIDLTETDLMTIIESSISELDAQIKAKNISIAVEVPSFSTVTILDKNRIHQVVTNIIGNAIKFSPESGIIAITLSETKLYVNDKLKKGIRVDIKDEGMGIPEGEENDIFNAFTQSTKTYDGSGGTGLGLSISKAIIQAHNGEIMAKNNNDQEGSTFSFIVPRTISDTDTQESDDE